MPGASHRADAVILGQGEDERRYVIVVELKQWDRAIGDDAHWVRFQ